MAYCDVVADYQGITCRILGRLVRDVSHAEILNIGAVADTNMIYIAPQHGIAPDRGIAADTDVADDLCGLVNENAVGQLGEGVEVGLQCHVKIIWLAAPQHAADCGFPQWG